MNLTRGINLKKISEAMPGASGAEVKVKSGDEAVRAGDEDYFIKFICSSLSH